MSGLNVRPAGNVVRQHRKVVRDDRVEFFITPRFSDLRVICHLTCPHLSSKCCNRGAGHFSLTLPRMPRPFILERPFPRVGERAEWTSRQLLGTVCSIAFPSMARPLRRPQLWKVATFNAVTSWWMMSGFLLLNHFSSNDSSLSGMLWWMDLVIMIQAPEDIGKRNRPGMSSTQDVPGLTDFSPAPNPRKRSKLK